MKKSFRSMMRTVSILLLCIFMLSFQVQIFAAGNASITVSSVTGSPGDTVDITFSISNNPGFASAKMTVSYDSSALELTGMSAGIMNGAVNPTEGIINHASATNTTSNGNLFTATFKIKENAAASSYTVGVSVSKFNDENGSSVGYSVSSGTVNVTANPQTVNVTGITLSPTTLTLNVGASGNLTATVTPSNATNKSITYTSSSNSIATVSINGTVTAVAVGNATITATTADGNFTASCSVNVNTQTIAVTGITLSPTTLTLNVGATGNLTATVTPSEAANKTVTWTSSNTSVATVSNSGTVTAVAAGSATITVKTVEGNFSKTCSVTVNPQTVAVTGITLSPTTMTLNVGATGKLTATVAPNEATNKNITFTSSNTSVAIVSSNGTVTAIAAGSATITAKTEDGGFSKNCTVTVNSQTVAVTDITLSPTTMTLNVGATGNITATVAPNNATNKNVTWTSSNTSVATVSSSGTVTAAAVGNARITARTADGGFTAYCDVTIYPWTVPVTGGNPQTVSVKSITLSPTTMTLNVGETGNLTATVAPSNATNKNVTWTSSKISVATVSSSGTVTAVAAGSAKIMATTADGGFTAYCNVTVTAAANVEWDNPFNDVDKTDEYYEAVRYVYENGLFVGMSENEFGPDISMTRAMFVTVLGRLSKVDVDKYTGVSFDDVVAGSWYAPYVEWAASEKLVLGYGNGLFGIEDKITIEQAVVILERYAKYIGIFTASVKNIGTYTDAADVAEWAVPQMKWAVENGIYRGVDSKLNPQAFAKRYQLAEMLDSFASQYID